jgi:Zn-dependent M16 (insulinase) family peptidase
MLSTEAFVTGVRYNGFIVERTQDIPELHCRLIELRHEASQAKIMHIQTDDPENVFCLSFQTLPPSSNGIAHVLEHMVLCGSEKFPVKDPFFSMTRRSLNTFMNALTGVDFTCYPAASQIAADFYNLLEVYLDAVFHPVLSENSFEQEAHRLEFAPQETGEQSLVINGVVYNEMKGAFASPTRRLMGEMSKKMFPDTPYGYDSGGDPKEIPSLTLQQLKDFHSKHYHPSRCLFFFYGNFPLAQHLDALEKQILSKTSAMPSLPPPSLQPRHESPIFSRIEYPVTQETHDQGCYLALGWLTTPLQNQVECLALSILDIILMDTDASLLKHALLQSKLCRQATSSCDIEIAEVPYLLMLTGCEEKNVTELTELVFATLRKIAAQGIPKDLLQNALHQVEFAKSEISGSGTPFGLLLFFRAGLLSQHGIDPTLGLKIHSLFEELRNLVAQDPAYFSKLIHKYFLENSHFVRVIMAPSKEIAEHEFAEEKDRLKTLENTLSEKQRASILQSSQKHESIAIQDLSCLPSLKITDVPQHCRTFPLSHYEQKGTTVFCHETFTNGICYLDIVSPLPFIRQEDLWLTRLACVILPQIGYGGKTYQQALEYMQEYTGGIFASLSLSPQVNNPSSVVPLLHVKGKALERNTGQLIDILSSLLTNPRIDDRHRIRAIIEKHATDVEHAIVHSAMEYASLRSSSFLSTSAAISEHWYGISYLRNLRYLTKNYDTQEPEFLLKIGQLIQAMLLHKEIHCVACAGPEQMFTLQKQLDESLFLTPKISHPWESPPCFQTPAHDQGFIIPSQVGCTSLSKTTASYADPDTPVLCVAVQLLNNLFLHKKIREQGGAYGGGASVHPMTGTCCFYSYKDPNIFSTLQGFEESIQFLQHTSISPQELDEAKLGVFQDLDAPIAPGGRAGTAYSWWRQGRTDLMRQHFRDKVFQTSIEEIHAVLQRFFPQGWSNQSFITIGGSQLLKKEQKKLVAIGRQLDIESL